MTLKIKRIYEVSEKSDGFRILVDRLWPRGLSKDKASLDIWLKEIAPSTELRKWFQHDTKKWPEFQKRYIKELQSNKEVCSILEEKIKNDNVTLLYAAKDEIHNEAQVLLKYFS